jgi:hypothetical protein
MLTPQEQIHALRTAREHLVHGRFADAHTALLDAIPRTPTDSPYYPVMIGAANWIQPLNQPMTALEKLYRAMLQLGILA